VDFNLTFARQIGAATAKFLVQQGLPTAQAVVEDTLEALSAVPGFGPARIAVANRGLAETSSTRQPRKKEAKEEPLAKRKGRDGPGTSEPTASTREA
jgi:hypothetical protein